MKIYSVVRMLLGFARKNYLIEVSSLLQENLYSNNRVLVIDEVQYP